jgi:DNA polymerase III gamma/tau subunit
MRLINPSKEVSMSKFATILCSLLLMAGLSACSEDQPQQQPPAEPQQQNAESSDAVEQAKQKANEAVEKAKASVEEAKEAVEKTVDEAVEKSAALVEDVKKKTSETTQQAVEKAKSATAPAVEKVNQLVASSSQKLSNLSAETQSKEVDLTAMADSAAATAAKKASDIVPPETIKLENKFGTVTLTHKFHAETYGCPTCHGDNTPGPFELTKDLAHSSMCKDCHQGSGGPVKCTECHVK